MISRKPYGKSFTYRYSDGKTVKNKKLKQWIKALAIPPAWEDVVINSDQEAKIHATGRDARGRKQYIYNEKWSQASRQAKFERIVRFGAQLETMRRVTGQHLTQRPINEKTVLACMTRMLDEAFFRPGNRAYTRENRSYGLTTLRVKHMSIRGDVIEFDYTGKSDQQQHRVVSNQQVCSVLRELEEMVGYEIFDVTLDDGERRKFSASDLNHYISEIMGESFSAKDFRTWAGTVLTAVALERAGSADNQRAIARNVQKVIREVAGQLGNTPAVCRGSYVHPQVILQYETGRTLQFFKDQVRHKKGSFLNDDERATLLLLEEWVSGS